MRKNKKTGAYIWTKDEEEYLIKNYKNTPNSEIAKVLNKTVQAIAAKGFHLSLKSMTALKSTTKVKQQSCRTEKSLRLQRILFVFIADEVWMSNRFREIQGPPSDR